MRDIVLTMFVFGAVPFILRWPTIGVFMWAWISVMNPHRLTWGFAYDFRYGYFVALATLAGIFFSKQPRHLPITPVTIVLALMCLQMNVSTIFAIDISLSLEMWKQVMKIQFMVFVTLYLLHSKQHVQWLIWILAGSVAFYGIKGGIFTITHGGEYRVWGPAGSFIEENNALALMTIMTIPLLYYLLLQAKNGWVRFALFAAMVLCGFSALGSHSRGGFVAIGAMVLFLWWKSRSKVLTGLVLVVLVPVAFMFMPEKWHERMQTIENYEQDESAMGRFNAWALARNVAADRPLVGGGFEMYSRSLYNRYAPDPTVVRSAHSIYYQMLGEHGYPGLLLFLLLWILVWRDASWIIRYSRDRKDLQWASDLARMIQVSFVGYFVGGAFLNLAYYDVPYDLLIAMVLTRILVNKERTVDRNEDVTAPQMDASETIHRPAVQTARFEPRTDSDK
jgi:probable O-glycosylation ligase (exosortase A-associated)